MSDTCCKMGGSPPIKRIRGSSFRIGASWKAKVDDLERQLVEAQVKLDHWENGVQDEDCPYLADVKRAQRTIEAIREWGKDFASDNEEFDAIMGEGE